ncbi:MAG: lysylphosphatidylglycerol synthase domain-containing protein [Geminicoccaceae bacterium]|nr:lysylphosphatidylglycerol synthase domain-containing protein [Geminicoccaceae bacterium]
MRIVTSLGWLLGLGLIILLVVHYGAGPLGHALAVAGAGMMLAPLAHLPSLMIDTLGWWWLLSVERGRPGYPWLLLYRWVGVAVNGTLPVAQVGGEVIRARLAAQGGAGGAHAGASVVVDLTLGLMTQILFALIGLGLLINHGQTPVGLGALALALLVFALMVGAFATAQARGMFRHLAGPVARFVGGRGWRDLAGGAAALDQAVAGIWRRPRPVMAAASLRLAGWVIGSLELYVAFWLLGQPIGIGEAVALEATAQVVRSAAFVIPGGLGAQEGGLVLAGSWLGLPPEITLAAALIKRARELIIGISGLVLWSLIESARSASATRS